MQTSTIIGRIVANDRLSDIARDLDVKLDDLKGVIIDALYKAYSDTTPLSTIPTTKAFLELEELAHAVARDNIKYDEDSDDTSDISDASIKYQVSDSKLDECKRRGVDKEKFESIIRSSNIKFSEEQIKFMESAVIDGRNIALLAPAGYGKSATLETTIKLFKACVKPSRKTTANMAGESIVQLCASTGRAASLIKARTLHSLLSIGLGNGAATKWYSNLMSRRNRAALSTLDAMECIIIDEISMVGGKFLNKISEYLSLIKQVDEPFGGVQVIFVGDFAQIPPINDIFAFQAKAFKDADVMICKLTKCFRQADPVFQHILDNLRVGKITNDDFLVLQNCTSISEEHSNGIKPTRLRSTNAEVDFINQKEMERLCNDSNQTTVEYKVRSNECQSTTDKLCKMYAVPTSVHLAVGAQVMLTFNISKVLVNGTIGVITRLCKDSVILMLPNGNPAEIPYIGFKSPDCDDVFAAKDLFQYMPIRIAYAISIHKAQGSTIPLLEIDCKKVFASGQLYVGISRAKDLEGLIVKNLHRRLIVCSPIVKKFYESS